MNKQLSMLNYKLQSNISELGNNFYSNSEDMIAREVGPSTFYKPGALDVDHDTNEEIFSRKKAWAELEREQEAVRSNIRTLMRKAPESTEMENPLLAMRIAPKEPRMSYKVPQDVILEKQHKRQLDEVSREQPATRKARAEEPATSAKREKSTEHIIRSKEKLTKDRSNEDLSMSS